MTVKKTLTVTSKNEAWILRREEIETDKEGVCNIYVLIDAFTGYCFGQEICVDHPNAAKIVEILNEANLYAKTWPQKIYILKKDPFADVFEVICKGLKISCELSTTKELQPYVKTFKDSFQQFKKVDHTKASNNDDVFDSEFLSMQSEDDKEQLEAFVPDSYQLCSCASGKKFKFCCQKAFKDITFAMCAAQEGKREYALKFIKSAEAKVGRTAEVVCRLAICWSYFDINKFKMYLAEALEINPKHPRANYVCGIEAKMAGDFEQAVLFYKKALEGYPIEDKFHLNETYNNLGTAYYELKKYKEAKESWEKGLVQWPKDRMIAKNLFDFIYNNADLPKPLREVSPFILKFLKI